MKNNRYKNQREKELKMDLQIGSSFDYIDEFKTKPVKPKPTQIIRKMFVEEDINNALKRIGVR